MTRWVRWILPEPTTLRYADFAIPSEAAQLVGFDVCPGKEIKGPFFVVISLNGGLPEAGADRTYQTLSMAARGKRAQLVSKLSPLSVRR